MSKLLIIADDLTGSLDTGVQFSKHGINTVVEIMHDETVNLDTHCDVLVIDTDSRHISPELAYKRVLELVRAARDAGFNYIFKKTDSMLRGNIGSELAALVEASSENELIFMPAYPKAKRYTIKGRHYLGDTPLSCTVFAKDPSNPVNHDEVKEIIHEQTALPVDCVYYDQYNRLKETARKDKAIIVVDGRNDEELFRLGRILKDANKLKLLAGCAGFAELLPDLLGFQLQSYNIETRRGNRLIVSGSVNPMALSQVSQAINYCGYSDQALTIDQMIASDEDDIDNTKLISALKSHGKAVIWTKGTPKTVRQTYAEAIKKHIKHEDVPTVIANNIGRIAGSLLMAEYIQSLIVFGGDTLLGIAKELGCNSIKPVTDVLPGIVFARFNDERYKNIDVITKAGGFGDYDVIAAIEEFLDKNSV
ncbi:MAG: four-carbon acid sugar kinase family protein [Acetivibrionales bacterium]|jgi:uncharacterized protein YgbK (DUF1537 family)